MQILNIQDGVVKSALVQQIQARAGEMARVQDVSQVAFDDEMARKADETVEELNQGENEAIQEEEERGEQQQRRRRRRRHDADEPEEEAEDTKPPPHDSHHIDVTI